MSQLRAICKDETGNNFLSCVVKKKHSLASSFKQSGDPWHALVHGQAVQLWVTAYLHTYACMCVHVFIRSKGMLAFEPTISIWMKKSGTKICFLAFSLLLKHLRDVQLALWREKGEGEGDHVSIYRFAGLLGIITLANDSNLAQTDCRKESRSLSFHTVEHSQHGPL